MSLNFRDGSRYGRTTKRKKTNLILNILIGIVFIFIIVLGSSLFFGKSDPDNEWTTNEQELSDTTEEEQEDTEESASKEEEESGTDSEPAEEEKSDEEKDEDKEKTEEEENEEGETEVSENSDDPNVIKTITNSSWGPIGTAQSEPHTSIYSDGHVDWKEKLDAVHASTGLNSGDYTLFFLGNGGSEHHSVASIRNKSTGENFKVYLEWVTSKGWKTTKIEQVKSL